MSATEALLRCFEERARAPQRPLVAALIDACIESAKAAMVCSDACGPIADVFELQGCVHRTRAASDLSWATAIALLHADAERDTLRALIEACRIACGASAEVCTPHAPHHAFCRLCGDACQRTTAACSALLACWSAEESAAQAH